MTGSRDLFFNLDESLKKEVRTPVRLRSSNPTTSDNDGGGSGRGGSGEAAGVQGRM
uniref:Uncharacterized protein n=1 Tax=Helianthus annuus TaxID=4232 RepID=A0A251U4Y1_HELAN